MVWNKIPEFLHDSSTSICIINLFRGYFIEEVTIEIVQNHLVILPRGMINHLQPLEVSVNKPFKDNL